MIRREVLWLRGTADYLDRFDCLGICPAPAMRRVASRRLAREIAAELGAGGISWWCSGLARERIDSAAHQGRA